MRARAFSLLELLVVAALLVAIAGLVVPRVAERASRLELGEAALAVAAAIEAARADAMNQARPMIVRAVERDGRAWIEMQPAAPQRVAEEAGAAAARGTDDSAWRRAESDDPSLSSDAPLPARLLDLPRGVVVRRAPPELAEAEFAQVGFGRDPSDPSGAARMGVADETDGRSESLLLAVFLPDGGAVAIPARYVLRAVDAREGATGLPAAPARAWTVEVIAATGLCRVTRWSHETSAQDLEGEPAPDARGEALVPDAEMRPAPRPGGAPAGEGGRSGEPR